MSLGTIGGVHEETRRNARDPLPRNWVPKAVRSTMGENRRAWEDWGRVDPLWAILTEPAGRNGNWDLDAFFESGQRIVDSLWEDGRRLGVPARTAAGLDFGCGVGRLSRALAQHVQHVVGLDIAESMVAEARRLNHEVAGCEFVVLRDNDLRAFADGSFDVVITLLALQHIPSVTAIETYLREFVRILAPDGLLIFQLPTHVPAAPARTLRSWLRPRTRLGDALRRVGVSPHWLYRRLRWTPAMPMMALSYERAVAVLSAAGGCVLSSQQTKPDHGGVESRYYHVTRVPVR
jgi:SAM-dependent methyltransferase